MAPMNTRASTAARIAVGGTQMIRIAVDDGTHARLEALARGVDLPVGASDCAQTRGDLDAARLV